MQVSNLIKNNYPLFLSLFTNGIFFIFLTCRSELTSQSLQLILKKKVDKMFLESILLPRSVNSASFNKRNSREEEKQKLMVEYFRKHFCKVTKSIRAGMNS